jgi:hypothetical protein
MQLRKHIIDKIETVLGSLKTVHWNKTQKEAFVKSIKNEMQKCVSELMNSKRKRQEDREKAKAATQSSLDIPLFDDEKIKTDPEDLRRSERNPKPPFKRVSNSGRFGKR